MVANVGDWRTSGLDIAKHGARQYTMMHYDRSIPSNACLRPHELFLPITGGVDGLCKASALAPILGSTNELVLLLLLIARERVPSA